MTSPQQQEGRPATPKNAGLNRAAKLLIGSIEDDRAAELWSAIVARVKHYGFSVDRGDLEPPRTGIFNGREITVDADAELESQCFILLHLFGHSVQWVAPSLEHKTKLLQETTDKPRFLEVLHDYEFEAACFGLQVLHECGVTDLDQWFSDFVEADWRYVERYYQTGQIEDFGYFIVVGAPIMKPLPIPTLELKEVQVRFAF